ncbi:hypothetical protein Pdw03_3678 [Penicillium digitatum]|uniref:Uncharacterized protein n=1 Tax=Penicillium digitatum TaxID=36651 RepID=A0A7T6XGQ9_PENDI|nr:hypothetical protein Pdw03_3678 [Penicillium digitatum]
MAANLASQNGLPTNLPLRQDISVVNMGLFLTPEASLRYADLWKQLTEQHPPTEHLVATCLVGTYIQAKHIPGLRAVLPRLPKELAAVLPDLLGKTTSNILMLPALPNEFNEIFSLSLDEEAAFRHQLLGLQPKLKHAITLSNDELNGLLHYLPSLPSNISTGFKIPLQEYASVNVKNEGLSDQLRVVWAVNSYQDWFAVYNAISFFEGLTSFATAIQAIKPSQLQFTYWSFYHYFIRIVVAGLDVKV